MDGITLAPEQDQFAADEVVAGRFRDKAEVVAAAVDLLRRREAVPAELLASVLAAEEEPTGTAASPATNCSPGWRRG